MNIRLLLGVVIASAAFGQTTAKDAMAKHWKTSGEFTIAVAKAMPADGYTFRPSPEEMNFGQLMAHIAVANVGACAAASGLERITPPPKIAEWMKGAAKGDVDKDTAVEFVTGAFEFCDKAVAAMTPERMDTIVGPPARKMTGFEWLWSYFTHTAHHRGQAEVYLRVKGIKPPDYAF
ncbi:MAG: DinB family protein [Bryobacteraceae bacterium]